jgi:hypothetical protein
LKICRAVGQHKERHPATTAALPLPSTAQMAAYKLREADNSAAMSSRSADMSANSTSRRWLDAARMDCTCCARVCSLTPGPSVPSNAAGRGRAGCKQDNRACERGRECVGAGVGQQWQGAGEAPCRTRTQLCPQRSQGSHVMLRSASAPISGAPFAPEGPSGGHA